jgi:hypothetical protein
MIAGGDGRNPPDLKETEQSQALWRKERAARTSGIKEPQRVRVLPNHDGNRIIVEDLKRRKGWMQ